MSYQRCSACGTLRPREELTGCGECRPGLPCQKPAAPNSETWLLETGSALARQAGREHGERVQAAILHELTEAGTETGPPAEDPLAFAPGLIGAFPGFITVVPERPAGAEEVSVHVLDCIDRFGAAAGRLVSEFGIDGEEALSLLSGTVAPAAITARYFALKAASLPHGLGFLRVLHLAECLPPEVLERLDPKFQAQVIAAELPHGPDLSGLTLAEAVQAVQGEKPAETVPAKCCVVCELYRPADNRHFSRNGYDQGGAIRLRGDCRTCERRVRDLQRRHVARDRAKEIARDEARRGAGPEACAHCPHDPTSCPTCPRGLVAQLIGETPVRGTPVQMAERPDLPPRPKGGFVHAHTSRAALDFGPLSAEETCGLVRDGIREMETGLAALGRGLGMLGAVLLRLYTDRPGEDDAPR